MKKQTLKRFILLFLSFTLVFGNLGGLMVESTYAASTEVADGASGMTLEDNIVLQFAQAIGFDSKAYLASPSAWKVINRNVEGFWQTAEGKKIASGGPAYAAGAAVAGGPSKGLWEDTKNYLGISTWKQFNNYMHRSTSSGGGVMCAGLVTAFMNYIRTHKYSDPNWKAYYDAYNMGYLNRYDPDGCGRNSVSSSFAGCNGIHVNAKNKSNIEFAAYTIQKNTSEKKVIEYLDGLAPGAILIYGETNTSAVYPEPVVNGKYVSKNSWAGLSGRSHAAIYVGKINGLHWMFDTGSASYKPRIRCMEFYALNFTSTVRSSSRKLTRIAGMKLPSNFNNNFTRDNSKKGFAKDTDKKWKYFTNGMVDTSYNKLAKSPKTKKYCVVRNGVFDRTYSGLWQSPKNGQWYYCRKGVLDYTYTGVAKHPKDNNYYYCTKGRIDSSFTGLAKCRDNGKWYYIRRGIIDTSYTGLQKSPKNGKWYYINKGVLDYSYTGLGRSPKTGKLHYCKNGILDRSFSGKAKDATGKEYTVVKGVAKS